MSKTMRGLTSHHEDLNRYNNQDLSKRYAMNTFEHGIGNLHFLHC